MSPLPPAGHQPWCGNPAMTTHAVKTTSTDYILRIPADRTGFSLSDAESRAAATSDPEPDPIGDRLRAGADHVERGQVGPMHHFLAEDMRWAADEIERLRERLDESNRVSDEMMQLASKWIQEAQRLRHQMNADDDG